MWRGFISGGRGLILAERREVDVLKINDDDGYNSKLAYYSYVRV